MLHVHDLFPETSWRSEILVNDHPAVMWSFFIKDWQEFHNAQHTRPTCQRQGKVLLLLLQLRGNKVFLVVISPEKLYSRASHADVAMDFRQATHTHAAFKCPAMDNLSVKNSKQKWKGVKQPVQTYPPFITNPNNCSLNVLLHLGQHGRAKVISLFCRHAVFLYVQKVFSKIWQKRTPTKPTWRTISRQYWKPGRENYSKCYRWIFVRTKGKKNFKNAIVMQYKPSLTNSNVNELSKRWALRFMVVVVCFHPSLTMLIS